CVGLPAVLAARDLDRDVTAVRGLRGRELLDGVEISLEGLEARRLVLGRGREHQEHLIVGAPPAARLAEDALGGREVRIAGRAAEHDEGLEAPDRPEEPARYGLGVADRPGAELVD